MKMTAMKSEILGKLKTSESNSSSEPTGADFANITRDLSLIYREYPMVTEDDSNCTYWHAGDIVSKYI